MGESGPEEHVLWLPRYRLQDPRGQPALPKRPLPPCRREGLTVLLRSWPGPVRARVLGEQPLSCALQFTRFQCLLFFSAEGTGRAAAGSPVPPVPFLYHRLGCLLWQKALYFWDI